MVEPPKSKSTQPRFTRRCVTPYTSDKDSHKTGIFGFLGSYLQEAKIDVRPSKNVFTEPIFRGGKQGNHSIMFELFPSEKSVQSGWSGCRTGNGKKLSSSQAQLSCETSSLLTSVKQALPGGTCGPGGGSRYLFLGAVMPLLCRLLGTLQQKVKEALAIQGD